MEMVSNSDFFQDTKRDAQFAEAEVELNRARKFNPKDPEIAQALTTVQTNRKKSQADVKKALSQRCSPRRWRVFPGREECRT